MAQTSTTGRPPADVFLPAAGTPASGGGGAKIMGIGRKTFLVLLAVAAIVALLIWRHYRNSGSSSASVGAASSTGIDPSTGFAYGSPDDLAALGGLPPGGGGSGGGDSGSTGTGSSGTDSALDTALEDIATAISHMNATPSTSGSPTGGNTTTPQSLPSSDPSQRGDPSGATPGGAAAPAITGGGSGLVSQAQSLGAHALSGADAHGGSTAKSSRVAASKPTSGYSQKSKANLH